ncbi:M24 family metallopeptidase [Apilactobacillus xinyiensis]|uniref:M24 family metallopeptidase n=1 Tax=Apilactobacillus xinyiensis TaxID=2841032 RepID=UPI002010BA89|nr:Xaa-Pro peptidase family protein [Apilactobacillus xinyiensis]MCL0330740.1 Xaa-Pro peptidase family protein [Apilactobacillus xinyiensis]
MVNHRLEKLRSIMKTKAVDSMIVTNPFNMNYLANFKGADGDGCVVVTKNKLYLVTDSRYQEEMESKNIPDLNLKITRNYYETAAKIVKNSSDKIAFENSIDFSRYQLLNTLMPNQLVAFDNEIERLRDTKDSDEINLIRKACKLTSEAYEAVLNYVQVGMTEKDIELMIYDWMIKHGAQKPSFDTIVASGVRSSLPHGDATNKKIKNGELVTIDFGFYYNDYTSDMTRTFAVGNPGKELIDAYSVVLSAQDEMIKAMHDDVSGKLVDAAARNYIETHGYGNYYGHGGGHSIGLDIHETPILNPSCKDRIYNNYVLTAEPGIYLPGKGGIRIEDDILVTENGPEILTSAPKDLIIL